MYDLYSADLADGAAWVVKTDAGVAVTPTTVVVDAATKSWAISFTGDGKHTITLVPPANLSAAEIGGYPDNGFEADTLTVTMPEA